MVRKLRPRLDSTLGVLREMELIRGWEKQYTPDNTGGLRLSKARLYREIGEEEGLGDKREGEIRVSTPASVSSLTEGPFSGPTDIVIALEDEPEIVVKDLMPGERREVRQELRVEDIGLNDSPYLFCLSKKPETRREWKTLRDALPERYDTWTVTKDVRALKFEIECGIERWMNLNGITRRHMVWGIGWVDYSYNMTPPAVELDELDDMKLFRRWFRKRKKHSDQQEYRLAWVIWSPQMEIFPDSIDIELTRTGLGLFKPWSPPTS